MKFIAGSVFDACKFCTNFAMFVYLEYFRVNGVKDEFRNKIKFVLKFFAREFQLINYSALLKQSCSNLALKETRFLNEFSLRSRMTPRVNLKTREYRTLWYIRFLELEKV